MSTYLGSTEITAGFGVADDAQAASGSSGSLTSVFSGVEGAANVAWMGALKPA